jgi:hypothetical protein
MFRKKFRPVYIVLHTWSFILLFKFVLWYTLFLFCVEFKIVLYQFLYRCGHFNLLLTANQTFFSQLLTVRLFFDSEWANFTGLHISKNESDIVWLAISDKLKWPHRNKNWYKTILNSKSSDNDVLLLSLHFYSKMINLISTSFGFKRVA